MRTVVERREAGQHLVQKHTERPPVDRLVVALPTKDLGCEVLGRTTERVRLVRVLHVQLAQPKVTQRDVARIVEQDVLRLQVTDESLMLEKGLRDTQRQTYR